jgi:hypothetical protein
LLEVGNGETVIDPEAVCDGVEVEVTAEVDVTLGGMNVADDVVVSVFGGVAEDVTDPVGVPVDVTVTVDVDEPVLVLEVVGILVLLGLNTDGDAVMLPETVAVRDIDGELVLVTDVVGVLVAVTDVVGVVVAVTEVVGVLVAVEVNDSGVAVGDMVKPRLGDGLDDDDGVGKQERSLKGRDTLKKAELPRALTILVSVW